MEGDFVSMRGYKPVSFDHVHGCLGSGIQKGHDGLWLVSAMAPGASAREIGRLEVMPAVGWGLSWAQPEHLRVAWASSQHGGPREACASDMAVQGSKGRCPISQGEATWPCKL